MEMKAFRCIFVVLICSVPAIMPVATQANDTAETSVTWSRQIAPIFYKNCTSCHHPGGAGPFSLLQYQDALRHGLQIAAVTRSRYMPPWLPEPGYGDFVENRRLSDSDVMLIQKWVRSGMSPGSLQEAPAPPRYVSDWVLGKPDLILSMERPFVLNASGADIFRNFIFSYPLRQTHFIRAMEIRPGVPQVVHHANVLIDRTASFRHEHPHWEDGIPGMDITMDAGNTFDPEGHFLFWKPDTPALIEEPEMPWRLDPGNDLILNMHLKPSGKPETIVASIGLYFSKESASKKPMLLQLEDDHDLDIPAGKRDFIVQDDLTLPVDVNVLGIYPHAHYLGKKLEGWAVLPDGRKKWLIRISDWDIDRQSVYRYRKPVFLPKATVLHMRYLYDNSAENVHNPNSPPVRVRAGNRSVDEMAHLWIQVLPANASPGTDPRLLLEEAWMKHRLQKEPADIVALYNLASALVALREYGQATSAYRRLLVIEPDSVRTLNGLGTALENDGNREEAMKVYRQAVAADPKACDARFNLGTLELKSVQLADAERQFLEDIHDCPEDATAYSGLGVALAGEGHLDSARDQFRHALALNPQEFTALYQLGEMAIESGKPMEAAVLLSDAVKQHPDDLDAREHLALAYAQSNRLEDALTQLRVAAAFAPSNADLHALLSQVLSEAGQLQQAIKEQNIALHLRPDDVDGWNNLGVLEARTGRSIAARSDFLRALQLAPDDPQARSNLTHLPAH
uniref:Uncharacterized protein n=1 Tax=Paracidobacterium acidisoli TaxID=2303751 RepID=A0A372IMU6_9BACT